MAIWPFSQLFAQGDGPEQWLPQMEAFAAADAASPVNPGSVLFVGSSSIAMWNDLADYFPDQVTLNRGFGGSQFTDLIHYADQVIFAYQPALIFVYEGDNDLNAGDSPKRVRREAKKLRRMIAKALGADVPVVFISPKPSVARWQLKPAYEKANALLKKYADKTPATYFADVWTPALDERGNVFHHIFLEDNLHMNADGYRIWQEVLMPFMELRP